MKFKLELDLEDFLEDELQSFESPTGDTLYSLKDDGKIFEEIKASIINNITSSLNYYVKNSSFFTELCKNCVEENKNYIVEKVIEKVSKSIINTKKLNDFKKTLEE